MSKQLGSLGHAGILPSRNGTEHTSEFYSLPNRREGISKHTRHPGCFSKKPGKLRKYGGRPISLVQNLIALGTADQQTYLGKP
jgi:hypothetical protein